MMKLCSAKKISNYLVQKNSCLRHIRIPYAWARRILLPDLYKGRKEVKKQEVSCRLRQRPGNTKTNNDVAENWPAAATDRRARIGSIEVPRATAQHPNLIFITI